MEVPSRTAVPPSFQVEVISKPITGEMNFRTVKGHCIPGAQMSTTAPQLEKPALASAMVEAPTVMTEGVPAGE